MKGEGMSNYGTVSTFKTKTALRKAVEEHGADAVRVRDTSLFDNKGTVTVASLADTTAVIVGPDVYNKRDWYANVKTKKSKDGTSKIVIV